MSMTLEPELADAMHSLEQALDNLTGRLRKETDYPIWGWTTNDPEEARREAIRMLRAIDYADNQLPIKTRIYPALIGTSYATLDAAREVNRAKSTLQEIMTRFGRKTVSVVQPDGTVKRLNRLRHALSYLGHLRLNQKQAIRRIVVCDTAPYRVGFTWLTRSARISRTNREKVLALLEQKMNTVCPDDPDISYDIDLVRELPHGEPLAIYRKPNPHPRVNLAFRKGDVVYRTLKPASLPILYPAAPGDPLPALRELEEQPPVRHRKIRTDRKVDDKRFLHTEPIHRYLDRPLYCSD